MGSATLAPVGTCQPTMYGQCISGAAAAGSTPPPGTDAQAATHVCVRYGIGCATPKKGSPNTGNYVTVLFFSGVLILTATVLSDQGRVLFKSRVFVAFLPRATPQAHVTRLASLRDQPITVLGL